MIANGRAPLLVWDFDGTLADTFGLIRASVTAALAAHRLPALDEDLLRSLVGLNLETTFRRLLRDQAPDEALITSLVASYRAASVDLAAGRVALFPGIDRLLGDLDGAGAVSAIATSKSRGGLQPFLDQLGGAGRFAAVITHDDVPAGRGKPHPEMVRLICAVLDRVPDEVIVIGDTAYDIQMGKAAGALTIGVTWGNGSPAVLAAAGPTWLVDDVDGLRSVLAAPITREGPPNTRL